MRVDCDRESLLAALQAVAPALSGRDIKPILRDFKAVAGDGRFTLMATDMEVGVRFDAHGLVVQDPGEGMLPAEKVMGILRESRDERLVVECTPASCRVAGNSLDFELPAEDPAHFPEVPDFDESRYHEVAAADLREMIRRVLFAVADRDARYTLGGVNWETQDGELTLVGTDAHVLALSTCGATAVGGHEVKRGGTIIPKKAMSLLERHAQLDGGPVRVCVRGNEVLFRTGRSVIYTRLLEGKFPDYRMVIPKKAKTTARFSNASFERAVRLAAVMTDQESVRVHFRFSGGKLTLSNGGSCPGKSNVEIPVNCDGAAVDIDFNPAKILKMLKVLPPDEELCLDLVDGKTPAVFRHGDNYRYLVVPLT